MSTPTPEREPSEAELELAQEKLRLANENQRLANKKLELEIDQLGREPVTLPSFAGIDRGVTTAPADSTLFSALLGGKALTAAAAEVRRKVNARLQKDDVTILVTLETDLVGRDALHRSVVTRIDQLTRAVDEILEPGADGDGADGDGADGGGLSIREFGPGALVTAALGAVPALLNLASPNRTLSSSASTVDDVVAAMAVTGALAESDSGATIWSDRTRLLAAESEVETSWTALNEAAERLRRRVGELEAPPAAERDAAELRRHVQLLAAVDRSLEVIAAPAGPGSESLLAAARMQELLHSDDLDAIVVVKGGAASASQLVSDRALWAKDPLSIVSSASIAYLILDPRTSRALGGGVAHGATQLSGVVGSRLEIEDVRTL